MTGLWDVVFGHSPPDNGGEVRGRLPVSASKDLGWTVTALFDRFPFQVGDRKYLAMIDTGASSGAVISYNDFEGLVNDGIVSNVKPVHMSGMNGCRLEGYREGKCSITIWDGKKKEHVLTDMPIGTFPGYGMVPILGREFIVRFGYVSFNMGKNGLYFHAEKPRFA